MAENSYQFELPTHHQSIIKVIGVGGGGSNAVNHMFNQGIRDVEFVVCNTDAQALKSSPIPAKLQIGINLTSGLGAGANPEKGRNAALESKEDIRNLLSENTKMVFITAGMGGGTGTGAAPVIAEIAQAMDILTVGIVTVPFAFEGKKKMKQALEGVAALKESCDTVLVILNDKLREIYGNLAISNAFGEADNVLTTAAKGIAEIITVPGYVNVDFEDVKTVMQKSGAAVMGSGTAEGDSRALRAAEMAISSPLLNSRDIYGAQKILLSIISGENAELQMDELTEITEFIQERAGDEAEVIFGHGVDPDLGENIRVTVIATGFDGHEDQIQAETNTRKVFDLESTRQIKLFHEQPEEKSEPEAPEVEEQSYSFERPIVSSSTIDIEEEEDEELVDEAKEILANSTFQVEDIPDSEMNQKKKLLQEKAKERLEKLKGISRKSLESDDLKILEVPAYQRKKVNLQNVPHSSERNISRYNLNDDDQILGNNKFLHDNVD